MQLRYKDSNEQMTALITAYNQMRINVTEGLPMVLPIGVRLKRCAQTCTF